MPTSRKSNNAPSSIYPDQLFKEGRVAVTIRQNFQQTGTVESADGDGDGSHTRCIVATTANITLSGDQTIDGVGGMSTGDRILVTAQTDLTENGLWDLSTTGAWSRSATPVLAGQIISVLRGTANGDSLWLCINNTDPVIGTDEIEFDKQGGAIDGSGTTNTVTKWTDSDTIGNSMITDDGTTVGIVRNASGAGGPILNIEQQHASNNRQGILVTQSASTGASTNAAIEAAASGTNVVGMKSTSSAGRAYFANESAGGVYIYRDTASKTYPGVEVFFDSTSETQACFYARQDGSGPAAYLQGGTGYGLHVTRNSNAAGVAMVRIHQDHATDANIVMEVVGDGTGALMQLLNGATSRLNVGAGGYTAINAGSTTTALSVTSTHLSDDNLPHVKLYVESFNAFSSVDTHSGTAGHAPFTLFRRSRSTASIPSAVTSGDALGGLAWRAYADSAWNQRALITCTVDGTVTGSTVPTRMAFSTGTTTTTEAMRIDSAQNVGIGVNATAGARVHSKINSATLPALIADQLGTAASFEAKVGGTAVFKITPDVTGAGGIVNSRGSGHQVSTQTITSNHTLLELDYLTFCDTATAVGAITVTLPTPAAGMVFCLVDSGNNAGTNTVTLARSGSEKIDNAAANKVVLNANGESVIIHSDGTDWFTMLTTRA